MEKKSLRLSRILEWGMLSDLANTHGPLDGEFESIFIIDDIVFVMHITQVMSTLGP